MGTIQDVHIESLVRQMEEINKERAVAVKALMEIEGYLRCAKPLEELVLAYGTAVAALVEINEWEEPNV